MKKFFSLIFAFALLTQCSIDRAIPPLNNQEIATLEKFKRFKTINKLKISDANEPGEKLWLCLTFVSKENKQPLAHQKVKLFHTSTKGEYEPSNPNDESTARLSGLVTTNESGHAFIQTILPGDYGSSADNRHIHTTVYEAKPEAYDIHFKQYTGQMGESFISGSDQHFLAELKKHEDSILVTFLTMEVKSPRAQY